MTNAALRIPESGAGAGIDALLEGVRSRYGYDFTHYSRPSLHRRLERAREIARAPDYATLLEKILRDENLFDSFLRTLSISVTEMFRDPHFYRAVREKIVPMLKTYPFVKIWHAGCATGEEVYSMAILLHEEGFLDRARIYATDFNKHSLARAEQGVFAAKSLFARADNYAAAGGKGDFFGYFNVGYDFALIADFLKERVTFSYHNLVSDGVFGEMNLIFCRNVLIYFDRTLQDHVLSQFSDSLRHGGFLCLGGKETINFTSVRPLFDTVDMRQRIYRKSGMGDFR